MKALAEDFPRNALEMGYQVSLTLPVEKIDALEEAGHIEHIAERTQTEITKDAAKDDLCTIYITGHLQWVHLAHMAVIKGYHDTEAQEVEDEHALHVQDLQDQLKTLQ